jgi:hypothetical protein
MRKRTGEFEKSGAIVDSLFRIVDTPRIKYILFSTGIINTTSIQNNRWAISPGTGSIPAEYQDICKMKASEGMPR